MRATIEAVLNDGDVEFAADFSAPWLYLGGLRVVEGGEGQRAFIALQREESVTPPIGRLYVKDGEWRGELRVAAKAFDLLMQGYFSPIFYQVALSMDCEPGPLGAAAELDVGMMDVAVTRFEPEMPEPPEPPGPLQ